MHTNTWITLVTTLAVAVGAAGCGQHTLPSAAPATGAPVRSATRFDAIAGNPAVTGQAVVRLNPGADRDAFLQRNGLELVVPPPAMLSYLLVRSAVFSPEDDVPLRLAPDPDVAESYPAYRVWAVEADREPMAFDDGDGPRPAGDYAQQSAVAQIGLVAAHSVALGTNVRVAVLDTGVDPTHPAWGATTIISGYDFTTLPAVAGAAEQLNGEDDDGDGYVDEAYGHGTHVAGIVHLAAPGARIVAQRVLDADGWGTAYGVALAVVSSVAGQPAQVINLSLGLNSDDPALHAAIQWATAHGTAVVASAGNRGEHVAQFPAGWPEVISVAAVDAQDHLADFSNRDESVDLCAPGVDIVSAFPDESPFGPYASGSGGSMAAPWVSGGIALAIQRYGYTAGTANTAAVLNGAVNIESLNPGAAGLIGYGRLDLAAALGVQP